MMAVKGCPSSPGLVVSTLCHLKNFAWLISVSYSICSNIHSRCVKYGILKVNISLFMPDINTKSSECKVERI